MSRIEVGHTGLLPPAVLAQAQALLGDVFDDLTDDDWEHCLGGLHALAWDGHALVGHAALVQRRLLHAGRAWRTGYVEGVAVRVESRRRGHGAALMTSLEQVARGAYDLAALAATDEGAAFYAARGWRRWRGPTAVLSPNGIVRTPQDDDCVFVLPPDGATDAQRLDLDGELVCDWRDGDAW